MSAVPAPLHRVEPETIRSGAALLERFREIRCRTEALCRPLSAEDCAIQSMADASPAKWHLAHTSWFFETFILEPSLAGYCGLHPQFRVLFNSYYNGVGDKHPRPERGLLSRPALEEIYRYRHHVDEAMGALLEADPREEALLDLIELGMNHEQQHQELILTDIKHLLSRNPLRPAYHEIHEGKDGAAAPHDWHDFSERIALVGHDGRGFAFDNESPRHRVFVHEFGLASRLVTNGEYQAFMAEGGYRRPELWLSEGWDVVRSQQWQAPLYWTGEGAEIFTLGGARSIDPAEPVCHVSYFEADAYARWTGMRLPTEFEWEIAASTLPREGHFGDADRFHPASAASDVSRKSGPLTQMFGDCWEWTSSAYTPYPGFRTAPGAVGEYNGKFMSNQNVLRGGSCATPASHIRASYRNFFPAATRWQFSGIRLARDLS